MPTYEAPGLSNNIIRNYSKWI